MGALVLRDGGVFAIYPEGTGWRDGKLHRGDTGAAHPGVIISAPLIPTGTEETDRIEPPGARPPRPIHAVIIRFGAAVDTARYRGSRVQMGHRITAGLMAAIEGLSPSDSQSRAHAGCARMPRREPRAACAAKAP